MDAETYKRLLYKYIDDRMNASQEVNGARVWPYGANLGYRMGMDALSYANRGQGYPQPNFSAYEVAKPENQPSLRNIAAVLSALPRKDVEGLQLSVEPYRWYPSAAIGANNGVSIFSPNPGDDDGQKYLVRHEVGHNVAERMFGSRINPINAPEYMEINREGWIAPDGQSGGPSGGLATEESFADDYAYTHGSPWYNTVRKKPDEVQVEMLRRLFRQP